MKLLSHSRRVRLLALCVAVYVATATYVLDVLFWWELCGPLDEPGPAGKGRTNFDAERYRKRIAQKSSAKYGYVYP